MKEIVVFKKTYKGLFYVILKNQASLQPMDSFNYKEKIAEDENSALLFPLSDNRVGGWVIANTRAANENTTKGQMTWVSSKDRVLLFH